MRLLRGVASVFLLVFAVAAASQSAVEAEAPGVLCWGDGTAAVSAAKQVCVAAFEQAIFDAPVPREGATPSPRLFVWRSRDFSRIVIGAAPSEASARRAALVPVDLRITATVPVGADVQIQVSHESRSWDLVVPRRFATNLRTIVMPPGRYRLRVRASGYFDVARNDVVISDRSQPNSLGELALLALPSVMGTVVDSRGHPVAAAAIVLPGGDPCATTSTEGKFSCQLHEPAPYLLVRKPAFADGELPLRHLSGITDIGRIELLRAAGLRLSVVRPAGPRRRLTAELFRKQKIAPALRNVWTLTFAPETDAVTFDALAAGEYVAVISASALERKSIPLSVREGAVCDVTISIEPFTVRGTVTYGAAPLSEGALALTAPDVSWAGAIPIEADGTFTVTLWERGTFTAVVTSPQLATGELVTSPPLGDDLDVWPIRLVRHTVHGRVIDDQSGEPAASAELTCQAIFNDATSRRLTVPLKKDASFEFVATKTGSYDCTGTAPGYIAQRHTIRVDDSSGDDIAFDLRLTRGSVREVRLSWEGGGPVANATVVAGVRDPYGNPAATLTSDAMGVARLRYGSDSELTIVVLPREGSFLVRHLPLKNDDTAPIELTVPRPAGAIHMLVRHQTGAPLPSASVVVRFNGNVIPLAAFRLAFGGITDGAGSLIIDRVPAGNYELWAAPSTHDAISISENSSRLRPYAAISFSGGAITIDVPVPEEAGHEPSHCVDSPNRLWVEPG